MSETFVLMYHRVCERGPATGCWFERGTAVTPANFTTQIADLRRWGRIVSLEEIVAEPAAPGRRCALTFDDGYRDALLAAELGVPITVFAVANHTGDAAEPLWFDRYYDIAHRARRRRGVRGSELGLLGVEVAPPIDEDLRWWVRGPLKEKFQAMAPASRPLALGELAEVLQAGGCMAPPELYLTRSELGRLAAAGHAVGGHGATHTRLTLLDDVSLTAELRASRELVDDLAPGRPRLFCYPDGACDERVLAAVREAGFVGACTVERGPPSESRGIVVLPRMLARDVASPFDEHPSAATRGPDATPQQCPGDARASEATPARRFC